MQHVGTKLKFLRIERWSIVWVAVIFCIWKMRNACVFNATTFNFNHLLNDVLYFSWWWLNLSMKENCVSYGIWMSNTAACLVEGEIGS